MKQLSCVLALVLMGCARQEPVELRANIINYAIGALSEPQPSIAPTFDLSISITKERDVWWVNCALRNMSSSTITVEGQYLPCSMSGQLAISAVRKDGRVVRRAADRFSTIWSEPVTATLEPGEVDEGRVDLALHFDYTDLPPEDLLILWTYLPSHTSPDLPQKRLSGLTVLKAPGVS